MVKQTVNFDDPGSYHLYFGDATGSPGSAVTFFEWPTAPKGRPGIGGTHHFALEVANYDGLLKWKRRLVDLGLSVDGPFDRHYFVSITFRTPMARLSRLPLVAQVGRWMKKLTVLAPNFVHHLRK